MAESGEGNNFDNGFEKLPSADDFVSSSSGARVDELLRGPVAPSTGSAMSAQVEPAAKTEQKVSCCSWMKTVDPQVLDLIYWRDVKKTGVVFGSTLVLLLSLSLFSVLSVVAYLSLITLTITISYRIYKNVLAAVQKTGEGHPFQRYLDMDISLPTDSVHKVADQLATHLVSMVNELRRLFLVEDMVDSLKFGLLLWVLTYIGAWFNGMTLIIVGDVMLFSVPKFYDAYKVQIDENTETVKKQFNLVWTQVQQKLPPFLKKKQA
jgi:hypothetical protein